MNDPIILLYLKISLGCVDENILINNDTIKDNNDPNINVTRRKKIIGKKDFLYELLEENFNCLNFLEAIKKNDLQNFTAETKIKINERVKNIIENTQKNINTILSEFVCIL